MFPTGRDAARELAVPAFVSPALDLSYSMSPNAIRDLPEWSADPGRS